MSPSTLEGILVGFRVAILSQQLSPSESGVCCSQPLCTGSGKHVPCYTGLWWGLGRHSLKGVASPYIPQRSREVFRSAFPVTGCKHHESGWLGKSPHSSISFALTSSLHSGLSPTPFQTTWLLPVSQPAWLLLPSLSVHHYFEWSAQNFLCDLISYDLTLLSVPPYLLLSLGCHLWSQ